MVECEGNLAARDENSATRDGYCSALIDNVSTLWHGLGTYWNHSAVGAGLALALLHFSVIRFDNIVVGTLIAHCIDPNTVYASLPYHAALSL